MIQNLRKAPAEGERHERAKANGNLPQPPAQPNVQQNRPKTGSITSKQPKQEGFIKRNLPLIIGVGTNAAGAGGILGYLLSSNPPT